MQAMPAPWTDKVYLSTDDVLDDGDILLAVRPHTVALPPTDPYTETFHATLPLRHDLAARRYRLILVTDADGSTVEANETNNRAVSDPFQVDFPPLPDLVPTSVQLAVSTLDESGNTITLDPKTLLPGTQVDVHWTVTNTGGAALTGAWRETVALSSDAVAGDADDLLLATLSYDGTIAAGASVTHSATVTIPETGFSGQGWFVVKTDSDDQ
jgi:hypothetical protein